MRREVYPRVGYVGTTSNGECASAPWKILPDKVHHVTVCGLKPIHHTTVQREEGEANNRPRNFCTSTKSPTVSSYSAVGYLIHKTHRVCMPENQVKARQAWMERNATKIARTAPNLWQS